MRVRAGITHSNDQVEVGEAQRLLDEEMAKMDFRKTGKSDDSRRRTVIYDISDSKVDIRPE